MARICPINRLTFNHLNLPPQPLSKPRLHKLSLLLSRFNNLENILTLIVPKGFGLLANVASSILIVRGLSVDDVGGYTLIFGYYMLLLVLSDLGINQTMIRYASKITDNEAAHQQLINWGARLKLCALFGLGMIFFAIAPTIASLWASESLAGLMRLGLLIGVANSMLAVPIMYFQSKQQFKQTGALIALQSLISFLPLAYLQFSDSWSLSAVVWSGVASSSVALAIGLSMMPRLAYWDWDALKMLMRAPKSFFLAPIRREFNSETEALTPTRYLLLIMPAGLLFALASRIDIWLMGYFLPQSEIGIYGMAQRVALPLLAISESVDGAISTTASAIKARSEMSRFLKSSLKTAFGLMSVGILYALLVPQVIPAMFGEAYQGGVWVASLLCLRFVIGMFGSPFTWLAYNFDYAKAQWAIRIAQLVAMVAFNLTLLSHWGIFAPASAWALYETIGVLSACVFLLLSLRGETLSIQK